MSELQDIFFRIQQAKKEQKDIRAMYKDGLTSASGYTDIVEQIKELQTKKKQIEHSVKQDFSREFDKLDDINQSLKDDMMLMADTVLSQLMKGEIVKVHDAYNNAYDPIVKVTFKKSDEQE